MLSHIAFESNRNGNPEIYVMNANGSDITQITDNMMADWLPAWSPNGSAIAFVSDRDGKSELYAMNADSSGIMRLTNNAAHDGEPAWGP